MSNIVIKKFGISTPFLRGYRELKIPVLNSAGNSVWPELFPPARLDEMREMVGHRHFQSQMMLQCIELDKSRLDPGALQFYDADFDITHARIGDSVITSAALYWDPSGGHRNRDGSVCVLLFRDDKNRCAFIHDVLYLTVADDEAHPLARQCETVLNFMQYRTLRRIAIETNGIGNALPEIMRDIATRTGANVFVQKIVNSRNKETRILDAIEPMLTTGRLYAHRRIQQTPLCSEMLGWSPVAAIGHDDGLDALAGALSMQSWPVRASGAAAQIYNANTNFHL